MRHTRENDGAGKVRHGLVFDDPLEMLDMVCEAGTAGRFRRYMPHPFSWASDGHDLVAWLGRGDLRNWDGVRAAISQVWKPGEDRVTRLLATLEQLPIIPPRDLRRRTQWRDYEGDFELDRFTEGRPCWRGPTRREVIGRQFLTFVVDVAADCETNADKMYWRAAVAIACAKVLEEVGYGVEVVACIHVGNVYHPVGRTLRECDQLEDDLAEQERAAREWDAKNYWRSWESRSRGNPRKWNPRVKVTPGKDQDLFACVWVKRPDDPIDLGMLTAVCSPWFFRLAFFGLMGMVPGCVPWKGLGHPVELDDAKLNDLIGYNEEDRERVIMSGVWDEPKAAALMRATLRRFADPDWLAEHPEAPAVPKQKRGYQ